MTPMTNTALPQPTRPFILTGYFASSYDYETKTHHQRPDQPQHADLVAHFATPEAAAEFVAAQPKALGLHATSLHTTVDGTARGERVVVGYVKGNVKLVKDGVNGGVNETGIKRLRRWVADLAPVDGQATGGAKCGNQYDSVADLLAAVDATV